MCCEIIIVSWSTQIIFATNWFRNSVFTSSSMSFSHFFSLWQLLYRGHCGVVTCNSCYRSYSTSMPAAQTQGWSAPQGFGRVWVSRHRSPWGQCGHRHVVSNSVCTVLLTSELCEPFSDSVCVWCCGKVAVHLLLLRMHHTLVLLLGF